MTDNDPTPREAFKAGRGCLAGRDGGRSMIPVRYGLAWMGARRHIRQPDVPDRSLCGKSLMTDQVSVDSAPDYPLCNVCRAIAYNQGAISTHSDKE